jgi:hypothetical protein
LVSEARERGAREARERRERGAREARERRERGAREARATQSQDRLSGLGGGGVRTGPTHEGLFKGEQVIPGINNNKRYQNKEINKKIK